MQLNNLPTPKEGKSVPIIEACIIGIAAGLSAVALSAGVSTLGTLRVHASNIFPPWIVLPSFGFIGGLLAGSLVEWVAPEASGSGIPQVKARLDRIIMALDLRIAVVKLIGGTIALGSGFFMGREGPTVQLGAAIAAPLTSLLPTTAEHKRQLIAAGAGAGLTAAFNAPLAGITFVMEELLRESKATTILLAIVACSVSCFVLNLFGSPHIHPAADQLFAMTTFAPRDVPFYVLLGVVAGLAGAFFNASILASLDFNRTFLRIPITLRVGLAGLISGTIIAFLPDSFHNYAAMRNMIIEGQENWTVVLMAFVDFFLLTIVAYGSGAPGGLFAPALGLGSALGYLIGLLELHLTGSGSTAAFALVGMGAFVSAVARTPLTAIVITFELTSNFVLLTPLMFTCVISSAVGDLVYKGGLYELLMRWNGIHLRGPETIDVLINLKAKDVLKREVAAFSSKTLVKDVLPVFSSSSQQGFVVIDRGKLVGVLTQADLTKIKDNESLGDMTVAQIMTRHPVAIGADDSLEEILFLFSRYHFTWLPVLDGDKLMGVIQQSDVLKALFKEAEEKKAAVVEDEKIAAVAADEKIAAVAADEKIASVAADEKIASVATDEKLAAVVEDRQVALAQDGKPSAVREDEQMPASDMPETKMNQQEKSEPVVPQRAVENFEAKNDV